MAMGHPGALYPNCPMLLVQVVACCLVRAASRAQLNHAAGALLPTKTIVQL